MRHRAQTPISCDILSFVGTWNVGPFDNDGAEDLLGDIARGEFSFDEDSELYELWAESDRLNEWLASARETIAKP
ncbi:MAG: hypothetical protein JWQ64_2423 [Subtercola sp.]|nr:hypothetical protein [Subtercola sp.]